MHGVILKDSTNQELKDGEDRVSTKRRSSGSKGRSRSSRSLGKSSSHGEGDTKKRDHHRSSSSGRKVSSSRDLTRSSSSSSGRKESSSRDNNREARPGSRKPSSSSTSLQRDHEDREAKQRARRSSSGAASAPGAVASTSEHKSRNKVSRQISRASIDDSKRSRSTNRSRDGVKDRNRPRATTPGVVSSNDDSRVSRKFRRQESKNPNHPTTNNAEQGKQKDSSAVLAQSVNEDEEEERLNKRLKEKEAQIGREIEDQQNHEANKQLEHRSGNGNSNKKRRLCFAIICLLLVGGIVTGALYAAGVFASVKDEDGYVTTTEDAENGVNQTDGPMAALPVTTAPSNIPSGSPTWLVYDRPPVGQCDKIAQGLEVDSQEEMTEKHFSVLLDVDLLLDNSEPQQLVEALKAALQRVSAPKLAGCEVLEVAAQGFPSRYRNLRVHDEFKYIIGNAIVLSVAVDERNCVDSPAVTCIGMSVELALFVKGDELKDFDYLVRLSNAFSVGNVDELGLEAPFEAIRLVSLASLDAATPPSNAPATKSTPPSTSAPTLAIIASPTFSPASFPTTKQPTKGPTLSPTIVTPPPTQLLETPSPVATQNPTLRPTPRPSIQPAPGVTPEPTASPSKRPTMVPSKAPSASPSKSPSEGPSNSPSRTPSRRPSVVPSPLPSRAPSGRPSAFPSNLQSAAPSRRPSAAPISMEPSRRPSKAPSPPPSVCSDGIPFEEYGTFGYCIFGDWIDQTNGVIKLLDGNFGNTQESIDLCLEACGCQEGATGCEMVWDLDNRGCYAHTQLITGGNWATANYVCYRPLLPSQQSCANPVSTFGPELAGNCIKSNGGDQNDGVIQLLSGDFGHTQESKDQCLEACSCVEAATGCEMIFSQENRGCYVHTQEVSNSYVVGNHFCHIAT